MISIFWKNEFMKLVIVSSSSVLPLSLSVIEVQIYSSAPCCAAQPDNEFLSSFGYGYVTFNRLLLRHQSFEKLEAFILREFFVPLEKSPGM
jgi:hypothetical protein